MPGSHTDSTCSSPRNDTVRQVIQNDRIRYQRQGYGLIGAIIIHLSMFLLLPKIIYMIYPTFTEDNYQIKYGLTVTFFHAIIYFIANLLMYIIYKLKLEFFERYKVLDKPWPWEEDSAKWRQTLKNSIKVILFNHLVVTPIVQFIDIFILNGLKARIDIESFPSTFQIMWQMPVFMVLEDTMFYWAHRLFHHPRIYQYIHQKHHEYNNSVSICAEYAHPIEFIVANLLPSGLCYQVLGGHVHLATILIWFTLRVTETTEGHSGYEFSWSPFRLLPLSGSSDYHNYHHSQNSGNYGSFFSYWDTFCGTNKKYFEYKSKKERESVLNQMRNQFENEKQKIN